MMRFHLMILSLLASVAAAEADDASGPGRCLLVIDAEKGADLVRQGDCARRLPPASTFKVPLAVMGFDAGILTGADAPLWKYRAEFNAPKRDRKDVDPTIWVRDSVLWYSREITRELGMEAFSGYVRRFDYGNADVRGDKGKDNGLTHSWLSSSLRISGEEQAAFIRKLLRDELPVAKEAMALTRTILPAFEAGGWTVKGKTGSTYFLKPNGSFNRQRPIGWFVGWAEMAGRRLVFASVSVGDPERQPNGPAVRERFLEMLPGLVD